MSHYVVQTTSRRLTTDGQLIETICFVSQDYDSAFQAAKQLRIGQRRAVIRRVDFTEEAAQVLWYRIGYKTPNLIPPPQYSNSYESGKRCRPEF